MFTKKTKAVKDFISQDFPGANISIKKVGVWKKYELYYFEVENYLIDFAFPIQFTMVDDNCNVRIMTEEEAEEYYIESVKNPNLNYFP
ncbi:MAG: hypothetical protein KBT45_04180 [Bacteroidales bacterium]|nr:hypothetical protein [Candidatus Colimorpha pelethequi]